MAPLYQDECTLTRGMPSKALIGHVRPQEYEDEDSELDLSSSSRTMPPPPPSSSLHKQKLKTNNTPPDHWPVSSSDDHHPRHHLQGFPFDVLNAKQYKKEEVATTSSSSKPLFFYSINTMLPQQNEECWENNTTNDDGSLDDVLDQALRTHLGNNGSSQESSTARKKRGILKRRSMKNLYTTSTSITIHNDKPRTRTVTFSQDSLIVIHTIPSSCTFSNIEMSTLYYTDEEIRTFKKEYKQEKKNERIREYSYWKAKVLNRWYLGSSSNSSSSGRSSRRRNSDTSTTCINGDDDLVDCTNIDWSCTMSSNDEKGIPVITSVPPACITIPSSHGLSSNSNAPSHWIQCTSLYP